MLWQPKSEEEETLQPENLQKMLYTVVRANNNEDGNVITAVKCHNEKKAVHTETAIVVKVIASTR